MLSFPQPSRPPLPVLIEEDDALPDPTDGLPGPYIVLELDSDDLASDPEPWEEAPTQKRKLYLDACPAGQSPLVFGTGLQGVQRGRGWADRWIPWTLGALSLPFILWVLLMLLEGKIPALVGGGLEAYPR